MDHQLWWLIPEINNRYERTTTHLTKETHWSHGTSNSGEMIFMDYRFALTAAMETTYTDALGRPKLHLAGFNMFRSECIIQKIQWINQRKDASCHRFGTAIAMQPRGMFAETLNQGMLEAAMHGYFDFWMRKNIFEKKAIATAAK